MLDNPKLDYDLESTCIDQIKNFKICFCCDYCNHIYLCMQISLFSYTFLVQPLDSIQKRERRTFLCPSHGLRRRGGIRSNLILISNSWTYLREKKKMMTCPILRHKREGRCPTFSHKIRERERDTYQNNQPLVVRKKEKGRRGIRSETPHTNPM